MTEPDLPDHAVRTVLLVPVLDERATVDVVVDLAAGCRAAGVVDDVVVVDGGSVDGTAAAFAAAGVTVLHAARLPPGGDVLGKGDSVWRAAATLDADRIVLVDGDVEGLDVAAVARLAAGLDDPRVHLVKGAFARRQRDGGALRELGGRITELLARPLLARFAPDLDHVTQPLSGQQAVRTTTLRSLPVLTGYGLELGLLLAVRARHGADAVVGVELPAITHDSKADARLVPMAHEVLAAAAWGLGLTTDSAAIDSAEGPGAGLVVRPPTAPPTDRED